MYYISSSLDTRGYYVYTDGMFWQKLVGRTMDPANALPIAERHAGSSARKPCDACRDDIWPFHMARYRYLGVEQFRRNTVRHRTRDSLGNREGYYLRSVEDILALRTSCPLGRIVCDACLGLGVELKDLNACHICLGHGHVRCKECNGIGWPS